MTKQNPAGPKDIFLCHNRADKSWVRDFGANIEKERMGDRNLSVFLDEWDIDLGENFLLKIDDALTHARHVALILSPEMLASEWCRLEWTAVLAEDPTNRLRRLIPIRLRDVHKQRNERIEIPRILKPLNHLDFRTKQDAARSFKRLIAKLRGEQPARAGRGGWRHVAGRAGGASGPDRDGSHLVTALPESPDEPDAIPEVLVSNLLPVRELPRLVYGAPTALRTKRDMPTGTHFPPCILREERLFTFHDLSRGDGPFQELVTSGGLEEHPVVEWRDRPQRWPWVLELLKLSLQDHLYRQGLSYDRQTRRYFFRKKGHRSVMLRWGTGRRPRCVVRAPDIANGNWVHQAARLSFEILDTRLYISIEPSYVFTGDGLRPIRGPEVGPLAMQWGGRERNGAVIRHTLMWSDVLTLGRKSAVIAAGDQLLVIGRMPITVACPVSLADDRVGIGALMHFTQEELDLVVPNEDIFDLFELPEQQDSSKEDDDAHAEDFGGL